MKLHMSYRLHRMASALLNSTRQGKGTYMNDCVSMTDSQLRSVITCSAANWQTLR